MPERSPIAAGAYAAVANVYICQPLDVLKTRVQESPTRLGEVIRGVYVSDGLKGFWRGAVPTIVRNVPGTAFYFFTLDQIRYQVLLNYCKYAWLGKLFDEKRMTPNTVGNALIGCVARGISGFIFMPITVLKIRFEVPIQYLFQSRGYHYTRIVGGAKDIIRTEGLRGLFRGFLVTSLRDVPHAGIYLSSYEYLKNVFRPAVQNELPNRLLSGLLAGCLSTVVTQPFDLVKTRIQLNPQKYTSMLTSFLLVIREEGVRGLFTGAGVRLSRKTLSSTVTWTIYEELTKK